MPEQGRESRDTINPWICRICAVKMGAGLTRLHTLKTHRNQIVFIALSAITVIIVLAASVELFTYIDDRLRQSAEQQVKTFTEQAASNVSDRMANCEAALGSFAVESDDIKRIEPALQSLKEQFGFASVGFARMDGMGSYSDGATLDIGELQVPETAVSSATVSYSDTYTMADGERVRLAQKPLYVDNVQIGALYVEVPTMMFAMACDLDMFDGRGSFILFDAETEEIIVPPADPTEVPIHDGTNIYDYLYESQQIDIPENMLLQDDQFAVEKSNVAQLQRAVSDGRSDLFTSHIDRQASYVCIAPVNEGAWYVCNIIPVENVRAEISAVMTAFQLVFALLLTSIIGALVLSYLFYRKRMLEKNVEMKTRLYGALSDSLDMAVNMYSPDDAVVTPIVAKASEILGFPMKDIMSKGEIADKIDLSSEGRLLLDRIRSGAIKYLEQGEFSFKDRWSHRPSWAFYSVVPFEYEGKRQLLVVFRDATDEKVLQLSMSDAMVAAETANKAKSDFLSNMSHEIRTPMNAIIGMAQIARKNLGNDAKVRDNLDKIDSASEHLLNIINDVLDISKIESGKMILASEVFSLSDMIDRVFVGIKSLAEGKNQTIEIKRSGVETDALVGDQMRLRQMLINLLTNATKYTPEGGHISFKISEKPSNVQRYVHLTFTIADNGIGMTEKYLEHLFEPFDMEGRSSVQGTGLGMPIVKNIVTMLNGDIHVVSTVDKGTVFTVSLDLLRASEDEESLLASDVPAATLLTSPDGSDGHDEVDLTGVRVLLAEDNDLNAEIAKELLVDAGLHVEWAENGERACQMFDESEQGYYDLILMDIQMPIMNGCEAARSIRALERSDADSIPIIAMSANAFMEDVEMSLRCGMDAHLSKPIDMAQVLSTIAQQIAKRKSESQV